MIVKIGEEIWGRIRVSPEKCDLGWLVLKARKAEIGEDRFIVKWRENIAGKTPNLTIKMTIKA